MALGTQPQTTPPRGAHLKKIYFSKIKKKFYPSDPSGYIPDNIWGISDMF